MQLSDPFVSVVIPAFNQAQYLRQAIDSVLAQTYSNYEIIVVDDGSTDETASIVKSYGEKIQYIHQENIGLAGARNTGIKNAKNKLICLLDADDEWHPKFLEKMVDFASQDPDAAVYYCCAQAINKDGNPLPKVFGCHKDQSKDLLDTILRAGFIIPSTVMMNYETIKSGDQFDINFRRKQDRELWIRLLKQGYYFTQLYETLVNYRIHDKSLTADASGGQQAIMDIVEKHYGCDDGKSELWDEKKRRAYGGAYRYNVLSTIQQQNDWQKGTKYFKRALISDPTLARDVNLFYELAEGTQPARYPVTDVKIDIENNAQKITKLIGNVVTSKETSLYALKNRLFGTAYYSISLLAYNTKQYTMYRRYLLSAIRFEPRLLFNHSTFLTIMKSFIKPALFHISSKQD